MRQEQVNTFEGGLVYDLNPLVTPNNVLTDVVNGTFITFNGNELSLQNDAGNIVINIKDSNDTIPTYNPTLSYTVGNKVATTDGRTNQLRYWLCVSNTNIGEDPKSYPNKWEEYIVRLSPGFYPLAVKEYGGVLYIISGKNILKMSEIYQSDKIYSKGDIVRLGLDYIGQEIQGHFYMSLKYNNNEPISNTAYWKYLGDIEEAKKYDEVEFGSYPSPNRISNNNSNTQEESISSSQISSTKILNEATLGPGDYLTFDNTTLDLDYITRPGEHPPRFYIVKLQQQLSSGYKDLTQDINDAFINFSGNKNEHWLNSPEFKFFTPHLFRGKIGVSLEITPLKSFTISNSPLSYNPTTKKYSTSIIASVHYWDNVYGIKVSGFEFTATIEGISTPIVIGSVSNVAGADYDRHVFQIFTLNDIDYINTGKILNIIVKPIFMYNNTNIAWNELPIEYSNNYIRERNILIYDKASSGGISISKALQLFPQLNACDLSNPGYRKYTILPLVNSYGDLVDMNLSTTSTPYVLTLWGESAPINTLSVGTYYLSGNSISTILWSSDYSSPQYDAVKAILGAEILNTQVIIEDLSCELIPFTLKIHGANDNTRIVITQQGMSYVDLFGSENTFLVRKGISFGIYVIPEEHYYETIEDTRVINEATTSNYTLIANLTLHAFDDFRILGWLHSPPTWSPIAAEVTYKDILLVDNYGSQMVTITKVLETNSTYYPSAIILMDGFEAVKFYSEVYSYRLVGIPQTSQMIFYNTPNPLDFTMLSGSVFRITKNF